MLTTTVAHTLADALEADRLRHRARRMELVVARLRERVDERRRYREPVPVALAQAIHGFEVELQAVHRRLAELAA